MAARKKTVKKPKPVTLAEFKAWLEGVEELQPEGWHPDETQWELIRNKMLIKKEPEPEVVYEQAPVPSGPIPRATTAPQIQHQPVPQPAPMPMAPPVMDSALPQDVDMTPAARAAMNGGNIPSHLTPGSDGKLKTPNIDTSDGSYNTSFE